MRPIFESLSGIHDHSNRCFWCHAQVQSSRNLENEASFLGPKRGSTFAGHFRAPDLCPPTVGGHRLGTLFLIPKVDPVLGPCPWAGSIEGLCHGCSSLVSVSLSLRVNAPSIRSNQSLVPDRGSVCLTISHPPTHTHTHTLAQTLSWTRPRADPQNGCRSGGRNTPPKRCPPTVGGT